MIGIPIELASKDILTQKALFGQYGEILSINFGKVQNSFNKCQSGQTTTCHLVYKTVEDATTAVCALDGFVINGKCLKASFGLTRYCRNYLQDLPCNLSKCNFIHSIVDHNFSFDKR